MQVLSVKKEKEKKEKMHFYGVTDNLVKCKYQESGFFSADNMFKVINKNLCKLNSNELETLM